MTENTINVKTIAASDLRPGDVFLPNEYAERFEQVAEDSVDEGPAVYSGSSGVTDVCATYLSVTGARLRYYTFRPDAEVLLLLAF